MNEITGKSIAAFWSKVVIGTRMTCLANTRPYSKSSLTTGTIVKPGKTSICLKRDVTNDNFWLYPPRRVSDVLSLSEDTITYRYSPEYSATWKIIEGPVLVLLHR